MIMNKKSNNKDRLFEVMTRLDKSFKPKLNENFNESTDTDNYENVVFLEGSEAEEPLRMLDEEGADATLEYLKQWHNPGEHEGTDDFGHGSTDKVYEKDGYVMSWNTPLGYIGLQYDLSQMNEESKSEVTSERASNFESLFRTLIQSFGYEPSQLDDMSDEERRSFFDTLDKKWVSDEEEKYTDDNDNQEIEQ